MYCRHKIKRKRLTVGVVICKEFSDAIAESKILMAMTNAITGEGKKLVFDLLSAA